MTILMIVIKLAS